MKLALQILLIFLFLQSSASYSQHEFREEIYVMDSLMMQHEVLLEKNPDSALHLANKCVELALLSEDMEQLLSAYALVADNFAVLNYYQSAIEYYRKAANIAIQKNRWEKAAAQFSGISLVNDAWGNYPESLKASQQAAHYFQKAGDRSGEARSYNDIGIIHYYRADYQLAEEYLLKAKNICLETGDSIGLALFFVNMGNIYADTEQYEKAFGLYKKAYDFDKRRGDWEGQSICLSNMGETLTAMGKFLKAEETLLQSLTLAEKHKDPWAMTNPLRALGELYRSTREFNKAIEVINRSLQLAISIDAVAEKAEAYALLTELYKEKGDHLSALKNYEWYNATKDSLFNQENSRLINEMEAKYQVQDKEKKITLLEQQNQINQLKHQEEIGKEKNRRLLLLSVLGVIVLISGFILHSFISKRKANKQLELQKRMVEKKNEQLQTAFGQIEEKSKEIIGSIQYAKRIQTAILPPIKLVNQYLPENFILYKPKDIVAGDFYWMEKVDLSNNPSEISAYSTRAKGSGEEMKRRKGEREKGDEWNSGTNFPRSDSPLHRFIFFAAADCTGHGVPGAMVSVMCSNALTRAVKELNIAEPAKILDKASQLLEERFERSEEEMKDGMDIALCCLDLTGFTHHSALPVLQYAGANNPLYLVRHAEFVSASARANAPTANDMETLKQVQGDTAVLYEFPPNKQPIGKHENRKPFTNHRIEIQKGDTIYLFSDGFSDQFGGERGKKFKSANFKKLILSIQNKSMDEQKHIINETFQNWKGDLEQIDDVCVIGVRM